MQNKSVQFEFIQKDIKLGGRIKRWKGSPGHKTTEFTLKDVDEIDLFIIKKKSLQRTIREKYSVSTIGDNTESQQKTLEMIQ